MQTKSRQLSVRIHAPARLHLGFLDLNGGLGRRFGSLGLAVTQPATDLIVSVHSTHDAEGPEHERAARLVERLAKSLGISEKFRVRVTSAIPAHAGLGSGTQLALAIGTGLSRLTGRDASARTLGELVERGARSSIGMAAFDAGGFVVDGGRSSNGRAPPIVAHVPFPEAWRALLVLDPAGQGIYGDKETHAFAALPEFSANDAGRLSRLMLMQLLPALHEHDIATFGKAVTELQGVIGRHFAAAQGGSPWSSPKVGQLVNQMSALGAVGIGQSSWGPTGFAFVETETAARRLYSTLVEEATAKGLQILIVSGRNTGADVSMVSDLDR